MTDSKQSEKAVSAEKYRTECIMSAMFYVGMSAVTACVTIGFALLVLYNSDIISMNVESSMPIGATEFCCVGSLMITLLIWIGVAHRLIDYAQADARVAEINAAREAEQEKVAHS